MGAEGTLAARATSRAMSGTVADRRSKVTGSEAAVRANLMPAFRSPKGTRSRPRKRRKTGSLWSRRLSKKHRDIRLPKPEQIDQEAAGALEQDQEDGSDEDRPTILSAAYPASFLYSPSCDSDGISTAIRIGRLRERRLDETFPAEVSDLETELHLQGAAKLDSTRAFRSLQTRRCGPPAGHCHVNREFPRWAWPQWLTLRDDHVAPGRRRLVPNERRVQQEKRVAIKR